MGKSRKRWYFHPFEMLRLLRRQKSLPPRNDKSVRSYCEPKAKQSHSVEEVNCPSSILHPKHQNQDYFVGKSHCLLVMTKVRNVIASRRRSNLAFIAFCPESLKKRFLIPLYRLFNPFFNVIFWLKAQLFLRFFDIKCNPIHFALPFCCIYRYYFLS